METLPRDLEREGAYPDPPPTAVTLSATHASWAFLTDREVWKVKRPVALGFLDYSDVEARRRFCEDEVRLGRRLAPDVYLGVVPVRAGPDGATFRDEGPVVDHAVHMRRLPDADCASSLLATAELGFGHLRALAQRLAEFYASVDVTPHLAGPERMAALVSANAAESQRFAGSLLDPRIVAALLPWQRVQVAAHADRLRSRAVTFAREGHGDLRLEHVYFTDGDPGRPVVIDPIEFNRAFRCGDVGLDVAFLAMELHAAGRPALASYFLSAFARASNDYGFFPLLDLFLSYRAWVRAKVACFAAADAARSPEDRARKQEEAQALLRLAASWSKSEGQQPSVIAIGGAIGTGKSTLADLLAQALPAAVISSDATRKHLAGLLPHDRGSAAIYTEAFTRATYDEVLRRTRDVVAGGRSAIVDATFRDSRTRASLRRLATEQGARFAFVELDADDETLRRRLLGRDLGAHGSDATAELLVSMRADWRPPSELPSAECVTLDARRDPHALADELVRRLG